MSLSSEELDIVSRKKKVPLKFAHLIKEPIDHGIGAVYGLHETQH